MTLIQRFGSAANLNIHLHCLVLDGVYRRSEAGPVFVEVPAPTDEALHSVLHKIITRMMKLLTRRGALVEEQVTTVTPPQPAFLLSIYTDRQAFEASRAREFANVQKTVDKARARIPVLEKKIDELIDGRGFEKPSAAMVADIADDFGIEKQTLVYWSCDPARSAATVVQTQSSTRSRRSCCCGAIGSIFRS